MKIRIKLFVRATEDRLKLKKVMANLKIKE